MIGYVNAANAERKPNLIMTEEERALLDARKRVEDPSPWQEPDPADDGVSYGLDDFDRPMTVDSF